MQYIRDIRRDAVCVLDDKSFGCLEIRNLFLAAELLSAYKGLCFVDLIGFC